MVSTQDWPRCQTNIAYSEDSSLNTLDICIPRPPSPQDQQRLWIVYIHGGAWRDPAIDASSFSRIRERLMRSASADAIAGYAALNYRLSPYPAHPANPSNPSDPARNAKHPTHIHDVLRGLLYLQNTHSFDDRYILVGHSCGSTLAFQVAMRRYWGAQYEATDALTLNVVPPVAIVGLAGIYDLPALLQDHIDQPVYEDFVRGAFGDCDRRSVSPTAGDYDNQWPNGELVLIAHSPGDSLVNERQGKLLMHVLKSQGWEGAGARVCKAFELNGDHDETWQSGDAVTVVQWAVQEVSKRK